MIVAYVSDVAILLRQVHGAYLFVACFCLIVFHGLAYIWIEPVSHHAENADDVRILIMTSYFFKKIHIQRGVLILSGFILHSVAVVIGTQIDHDDLGNILSKIPRCFSRGRYSLNAVIGKPVCFVISRNELVGMTYLRVIRPS